MDATKISYTTCPLCEATCGLEIGTHGREVLSIKGDTQDVFSSGYICPKAYSLKELDADKDRLREPMVRKGDRWLPVSWDDAFAEVAQHLPPILQQYGNNAIAVYAGNPNVHTLAGQFYLPILLQTLRTHNFFSASTVDQMPKQVSAGLMFGAGLSIPIPDLEHTEYLLLLGANPLVSNGSLMTAPNMRDRLRRLRQRGGRLVVIDPYRTRTAQEADEHYFIRPGTDAHFLFAIVHTLFAENLVNLGKLSEHIAGLEQVQTLARDFAPEHVAAICGIESETIKHLARDFAAAPKAAAYGRIGTCAQTFGTLTSWLVDVVNVLTGNLDREGGVLFPKAAVGARNASGHGGKGSGIRLGRWKSRVRGLPETFGELPVVCLAEEIETPGTGQVKALITLAGNPALSTPNGQRLQQAFEQLAYMVSVDMYLNETTRHANVILPPPSPLARAHYDAAFYQLSVHNVANYSPPLFESEPGSRDEWEIYLQLAAILGGRGSVPHLQPLDDMTIKALIKREIALPGSTIEGRDPANVFAMLPGRGPTRILDFLLRSGPYGDGFDPQRSGLSLAMLEAHPHGVDLGPLQPRIPEVLRTPSGKIELAPQKIVEDVERLRASLEQAPGQMVLIGRRDLRSNNSWMHNLHVLAKGPDRCTLHIHPDDAQRLTIASHEIARISSHVGSVEIAIEVTDAIMPGVVSIPHGWGHNQAGTKMDTAREHAGVNTNILTDENAIDPLSGNAVLNGIPVVVEKSA